jgi:hypothetical protein
MIWGRGEGREFLKTSATRNKERGTKKEERKKNERGNG